MAEFNDAEYVELFLGEARENLETLNTAIVGIEADPTDRATLDAVFRVAHSVKGMAATMGFDAVAALTHAMEDVFALLRERTEGLPKEAIDLCLSAWTCSRRWSTRSRRTARARQTPGRWSVL